MKKFLLIIFLPIKVISQYQTIGPNSCGLGQSNCHSFENSWWTKDNHFGTTDKFYGATATVQKVAVAYGYTIKQTFAGNSRCMNCHGTLITDKETLDIDIGVSCESCHGAGSGYKEPHTEGNPVQTVNRPGYIKALKLGMVENKNLITRARTCTKCHNITDAKLLTAGHPDGKDFDYIRGLRKVSAHWKHQLEDAGQLRMAFASVLSSASVSIVATIPQPKPITPMSIPALKKDSTQIRIIETPIIADKPEAPKQSIPQVEMPVFVSPPRIRNTKNPPPFPTIPDSLSDYQKAILIKRHLDLLLQWYNQKN